LTQLFSRYRKRLEQMVRLRLDRQLSVERTHWLSVHRTQECLSDRFFLRHCRARATSGCQFRDSLTVRRTSTTRSLQC
jgi:hypothetical protein